MWNSPKLFFKPIKRLKLIESRFPKRSSNFYEVLSWENTSVAITIFCIVCLEALAFRLDDVSNNQLLCVDFSRLRLSRPTLQDSFSASLFPFDTIDGYCASSFSLFKHFRKIRIEVRCVRDAWPCMQNVNIVLKGNLPPWGPHPGGILLIKVYTWGALPYETDGDARRKFWV